MSIIRIYSKIASPPEQMFFDLNGDDYTIVNDENEEFEFALDRVDKKCKILCFQIWNNHENQEKLYRSWLQAPDVYIVTNTHNPKQNHPRVLRADFLFNRTRAYYQQYSFRPSTTKWYFDSECYILPKDLDPKKKTKIFVAPNGTHENGVTLLNNIVSVDRPQYYKRRLVEFIKDYADRGHINNPMLWANSDVAHDIGIDKLLEIPQKNNYERRGYSPAHNAYYEDTFFHICVETIEYGSTVAVTEKIYDPLIKGHFVLPFSTSGTIKYLMLRGFKFPKFIDYSYDDTIDDELRFQQYTEEITKLLSHGIEQWRSWWIEYQDIRFHNQKLFWTSDYDRIDFNKIK